MKLEIMNDDNYMIFVNNKYLNNIDLDVKEDVISLVKDLIIKIKALYTLNMKGFYKVRVFPNKEVGMFLEIEKIDDIDYGKSIDLRVIVYLDETFFLKFDDFDYIPENVDSIFYKNHYYINMNDFEENIMKVIELGQLVYGDFLEEKLNKGVLISNKKNTEVF